MNIITEDVVLRKLVPNEGMVITDKETQTLRSTEVYLGKNENPNKFMEINADTPLPGEETEDEYTEEEVIDVEFKEVTEENTDENFDDNQEPQNGDPVDDFYNDIQE